METDLGYAKPETLLFMANLSFLYTVLLRQNSNNNLPGGDLRVSALICLLAFYLPL